MIYTSANSRKNRTWDDKRPNTCLEVEQLGGTACSALIKRNGI